MHRITIIVLTAGIALAAMVWLGFPHLASASFANRQTGGKELAATALAPPPSGFSQVGRKRRLSNEDSIATALKWANTLGIKCEVGVPKLAIFLRLGRIDPEDEVAIRKLLLEAKESEAKVIPPTQPHRASESQLERFLSGNHGDSSSAKMMAYLLSGKDMHKLEESGADESLIDFVRAIKSRPRETDPALAAKLATIEGIAAKYPQNAMLQGLLAQAQYAAGDYPSSLRSAEKAIRAGTFDDLNRGLTESWKNYSREIENRSIESWNTRGRNEWTARLLSIGTLTTTAAQLFDHGKSLLSSNSSDALAFLRAGIGLIDLVEEHPDLDERFVALHKQTRMIASLEDTLVADIFGESAAGIREGIAAEAKQIDQLRRFRDQIYKSGDPQRILAYEADAAARGSFRALNNEMPSGLTTRNK